MLGNPLKCVLFFCSETTDEQCIPESISEAHDSAIDSTEDIVEEEDEQILDEVEKDLTKAKIQLQQTCANQQQQPLTLEIQSSTESDKTVLSLKHKDDINNSVPNSPGLMSLCSRYISLSQCGKFNIFLLLRILREINLEYVKV